jgi:hypothetical protein
MFNLFFSDLAIAKSLSHKVFSDRIYTDIFLYISGHLDAILLFLQIDFLNCLSALQWELRMENPFIDDKYTGFLSLNDAGIFVAGVLAKHNFFTNKLS